MDCPCKSKLSYPTCCKPFHKGTSHPKTPEQLMRSRFCAYALKNVSYIMATTDPLGAAYQQQKKQWKQSIKEFCQSTRFQNLTLLDSCMIDASTATITFHATLKTIFGQDVSFTETSLFKKVEDRWLYHSCLNLQ